MENEEAAQGMTARPAMPYVVRRAAEGDLEGLVRFTLSEARGAEGRALDPHAVSREVEAGLLDPSMAL